MAKSKSKNVKVKLVKSIIGRPEKHRRIVRAMGLTRIDRVRELPDNDTTRGMIFKVSHLVEVVE